MSKKKTPPVKPETPQEPSQVTPQVTQASLETTVIIHKEEKPQGKITQGGSLRVDN